MAAKDRLTKVANISATAREIDFVTRFGNNWQALLDIMGVSRPIRKELGAVLKYKKGVVSLQDSVGEGEEIPYSQGEVVEIPIGEMDVEKYAKAVSIEAIKTYGYDVAVQKTDDAFLVELQEKVMAKFYTFAGSGELTNIESTFQSALAMAKGLVDNEFKAMHKAYSNTVGFVNVLDFYAYLGAANITVQTAFGYQYIKDFMGYNTIFLCSNNEVARNTVIATPAENIIFYYIDPADSDFARAGLEYTTDGVTNLIGFHTQGNYGTAVSECFALMGLALQAEYLNGIAVVTIGGSIGAFTVATESGGSAGKTKPTITNTNAVAGGKYYWKSQASTAPSAPTYGADFDATGWTEFESGDVISATNAHKFRVVEVNATGQAVATADGTVTAGT